MSGGVGPSCKECLPVRDIIKRSAGHFNRRAISKHALMFSPLSLSRSIALLEVVIDHHKTVALLKN